MKILVIKAAIVDEKDLTKKMSIICNKTILEQLTKNSIIYAKRHFDWNKNKKHYLEVFK